MEVFARLKLLGLKLHPDKCKFYCDCVEYIGHMIYPRGLGVVASKGEIVISIPRQRDVSRLCAFLELHTGLSCRRLRTDGRSNDGCWVVRDLDNL
jgi:hypothetical protein